MKHVYSSNIAKKLNFISSVLFFASIFSFLTGNYWIGGIIIVISLVLFIIGMIDTYKKVEKGEVFWERDKELFREEMINCPNCFKKIPKNEKYCFYCNIDCIDEI